MKGVLVQVRERGRAVALVLGVLAILGTLAALIAGPAAAGSQTRTALVAGTSGLARTDGVQHPVSSASSDHSLAATRGHVIAAASRASGSSRHLPLGAAALPAVLVVVALALTGSAVAVNDRRAHRRTSMALRGRAPPAPALA